MHGCSCWLQNVDRLMPMFNTAHIRQNDGRSSLCSIALLVPILEQHLKKEIGV